MAKSCKKNNNKCSVKMKDKKDIARPLLSLKSISIREMSTINYLLKDFHQLFKFFSNKARDLATPSAIVHVEFLGTEARV